MGPIVYFVPVALLYRAAALLQPPERLYFVTGFKLFAGRVIVLTQLVEVENVASRCHVTPNPASVLRAHRELLAMEMDIEAQFHSHPGAAQNATLPSPIDINTARRWETGAPFIGAVFSEGGKYVRFFNYRQNSEVIIYGKHIQTNEPNCFEISPIGCDSLPAEASEPGRLVVDRPPREDSLVEPKANSGRKSVADWLRRLRQ